jgi:Tol biopolymer transport system component
MNGAPSGSATPLDTSPSSIVPLSSNPQISADGRWVVFESRSSNLVGVTDAPNTLDVFAHDVVSNMTFLVSITTAGTGATEANSSSHSPRLTPDGRFVLFLSSVTNLVSGDAPSGKSHLFLRDLPRKLQPMDHLKIWRTALEWSSNAYDIVEHTMSDNAQVIAFKVYARGSSPASTLVFRYNVQSESLRSLGSNSYPWSPPQLSADGRFLAYEEGPDVLIWDDVFHTNFVVNLDLSNSHPSGGVSHTPVLAGDGRSIAFLSNAGDLVPGVAGGQFQVFWRDLIERITLLVSAATNGQPASANHELVMPAISADGFTVAFESSACGFGSR